jgi:hypothetical protein
MRRAFATFLHNALHSHSTTTRLPLADFLTNNPAAQIDRRESTPPTLGWLFDKRSTTLIKGME